MHANHVFYKGIVWILIVTFSFTGSAFSSPYKDTLRPPLQFSGTLVEDANKAARGETSTTSRGPTGAAINHRIVPIGEEKFIIANLGSTSVKMELQDAKGNLAAKGSTKGNIGDENCVFNLELNGQKNTVTNIKTHEDALKAFVDAVKSISDEGENIQAVFYKTVQGGPNRKGVFVLDETALKAMEDTFLPLAPEHNKFYALSARILERLLPNAIHLGRFEPMTHVDNIPESTTTSLPHNVATALGLDATGFHGASFAYLISYIPKMLKENRLRPRGTKYIMFHIGGSSSACMAENGKSLETSMMGTPESGFTQGTRITGSNVNPQMVEYAVGAIAKLFFKYYKDEISGYEYLANQREISKTLEDKLSGLVDEVISELIKSGTLRGNLVNYEAEDKMEIPQHSLMKLIITEVVRQRVNRMLTEESGLKGIAGIGTGDVEKIKQAANQGNPLAKLAYDILVYEARGYLWNYIGKLGGNVNVIVFTAGTGENDPEFRERVIGEGKSFGRQVIKVDPELNKQMVGGKEGIISTPDSRVKVLVIKANEAATLVEDCLAKYRQIVSEYTLVTLRSGITQIGMGQTMQDGGEAIFGVSGGVPIKPVDEREIKKWLKEGDYSRLAKELLDRYNAYHKILTEGFGSQKDLVKALKEKRREQLSILCKIIRDSEEGKGFLRSNSFMSLPEPLRINLAENYGIATFLGASRGAARILDRVEYFDKGGEVDFSVWEYVPGANNDQIRQIKEPTIIAKRGKDGRFSIFSGGLPVRGVAKVAFIEPGKYYEATGLTLRQLYEMKKTLEISGAQLTGAGVIIRPNAGPYSYFVKGVKSEEKSGHDKIIIFTLEEMGPSIYKTKSNPIIIDLKEQRDFKIENISIEVMATEDAQTGAISLEGLKVFEGKGASDRSGFVYELQKFEMVDEARVRTRTQGPIAPGETAISTAKLIFNALPWEEAVEKDGTRVKTYNYVDYDEDDKTIVNDQCEYEFRLLKDGSWAIYLFISHNGHKDNDQISLEWDKSKGTFTVKPSRERFNKILIESAPIIELTGVIDDPLRRWMFDTSNRGSIILLDPTLIRELQQPSPGSDRRVFPKDMWRGGNTAVLPFTRILEVSEFRGELFEGYWYIDSIDNWKAQQAEELKNTVQALGDNIEGIREILLEALAKPDLIDEALKIAEAKNISLPPPPLTMGGAGSHALGELKAFQVGNKPLSIVDNEKLAGSLVNTNEEVRNLAKIILSRLPDVRQQNIIALAKQIEKEYAQRGKEGVNPELKIMISRLLREAKELRVAGPGLPDISSFASSVDTNGDVEEIKDGLSKLFDAIKENKGHARGKRELILTSAQYTNVISRIQQILAELQAIITTTAQNKSTKVDTNKVAKQEDRSVNGKESYKAAINTIAPTIERFAQVFEVLIIGGSKACLAVRKRIGEEVGESHILVLKQSPAVSSDVITAQEDIIKAMQERSNLYTEIPVWHIEKGSSLERIKQVLEEAVGFKDIKGGASDELGQRVIRQGI